eukprot:445320-Prorocentrum_minimum.AAC.1
MQGEVGVTNAQKVRTVFKSAGLGGFTRKLGTDLASRSALPGACASTAPLPNMLRNAFTICAATSE